jgi:hypothetical protein
MKFGRLRVAVQHGATAFERGDFTEVNDADIESFLGDLAL